MSPWYLLAAIPVFGLLVLVHEFGHFLTAKWAGIRVEEFGIGFPPRLAGVRRGETLYSLNLLPIGGFVKMPGENGETSDANGAYDPRSFGAKPAGKRAIVLLAGVTMNLLLALLLFTTAEAIGQVQFRAAIGSVQPNSPAAQAGLLAGDQILAIDGQPVKYWSDVTDELTKLDAQVSASAKTFPVTLIVKHANVSGPVTITAQARAHAAPTVGFLGIGRDSTNPYVNRVPIWQAPAAGARDIRDVTVGTVGGIAQIIRGQLPWNQAIQGPVGIVRDTGLVASSVPQIGPYWLLYLTAALSLNLAFVNVLPIPALDGGRLLFIGIEVLRRGKRISPEREALVNLAGMGVLLLLMLLVTINDIGGAR
ncbi:MAG: site-2 protease family protein [Ktedonobacterales bacterium]|nr:site-2 protease family protein [Ktedonobacterales bacterium]